MNIIKILIHHEILDDIKETVCINRHKEENVVEYRTNYEPCNIRSTNTAIDNIITAIRQEQESFWRRSEESGGEFRTGRIEIIITREDETIISNLVINDQEELALFEDIHEFLKKNFYYL